MSKLTDILGKEIDATHGKGTAALLLEAWSHPYSCTCETCRKAWELTGPDPDSKTYGPFGKVLPQKGDKE